MQICKVKKLVLILLRFDKLKIIIMRFYIISAFIITIMLSTLQDASAQWRDNNNNKDDEQFVQDTVQARLFFEEAKNLMKNENWTGAIELLDKAIKNKDFFYEAYEARGFCHMRIEDQKEKVKERDYTEAITDYTNAIIGVKYELSQAKGMQQKKRLKKELAPLLVKRAWSKMQYDKRKYYYLAIEDYDEAFKYDRENWNIYIGRSYAYNKTKQYDKEIIDYRIIIREYEDQESPIRNMVNLAEIYFNMGNAYIDLNNDMRKACDCYKKSLDLGFEPAKDKVKYNCGL